jgi:chromosome partitioning protein
VWTVRSQANSEGVSRPRYIADRAYPDAVTTPVKLRRTVLVANQKGGVGKSSIVSGVGSMVAMTGRRVLLVDADQQGNATASDLGVDGDNGRSLAMAIQYGSPLEPVRDVRKNLDVIAGGPALSAIGPVAAAVDQGHLDLRGNLAKALSDVIETHQYDLVLIDSGPGDAAILDVLLGIARYLVVPTRDDDASLSGVELLARRYLRARENGSAIQLLGVVLFDLNPRATARNREVLKQMNELMQGSGATPFTTFIRSDKAAAVDLRNQHLTPAELVEAAELDVKNRIDRLRGAEKEKPRMRLWSRDPSGIAVDYQGLTREVLQRLAAIERTRISGVA